MKKFLKAMKLFLNNFIRSCRLTFIYQIVDNWKFSCLGRKPPELMWKALPRSPAFRYDAGAVQLGNKLYVFGGYSGSSEIVLHNCDVLDLEKERWVERFETPAEMAESHLAMTSDGKRFIFSCGGQRAINCGPSIVECFAYDTVNKIWSELPSLPEARYSLTAQYWRGRIHVAGGSKPDRCTPAVDHWSLAVENGKATEKQWRKEIPIPRGGPHRTSAIIDDKFYTFGGQEGDVIAKKGDPRFKADKGVCKEEVYGDVFVLKPGGHLWERCADMAAGVSHTEFSLIQIGNNILILGGAFSRNHVTQEIPLTDIVQAYHAEKDSWKIIGHLPYRTKTVLVAYYKGYVYFTTGQRDFGKDNPIAGPFDDRLWKAKIDTAALENYV